MAQGLAGKLLTVTIGGTKLRCQTNGSLNITANVSEDEPCKPDDEVLPADAGWIERNVDSRDWSISVSAKAFSDSVAAHNGQVSDAMISGNLVVQVEFLTTPGQHEFNRDIVYSGTGIITNFTLNAPVTGGATYDVEIVGSGPLTYTSIPVVTP